MDGQDQRLLRGFSIPGAAGWGVTRVGVREVCAPLTGGIMAPLLLERRGEQGGGQALGCRRVRETREESEGGGGEVIPGVSGTTMKGCNAWRSQCPHPSVSPHHVLPKDPQPLQKPQRQTPAGNLGHPASVLAARMCSRGPEQPPRADLHRSRCPAFPTQLPPAAGVHCYLGHCCPSPVPRPAGDSPVAPAGLGEAPRRCPVVGVQLGLRGRRRGGRGHGEHHQ